jgi:hypothetical protein
VNDEVESIGYMEGGGSSLILKCYPSVCLEVLRKTTKISVRITCLRVEICTRDLPNTKQEVPGSNIGTGDRLS